LWGFFWAVTYETELKCSWDIDFYPLPNQSGGETYPPLQTRASPVPPKFDAAMVVLKKQRPVSKHSNSSSEFGRHWSSSLCFPWQRCNLTQSKSNMQYTLSIFCSSMLLVVVSNAMALNKIRRTILYAFSGVSLKSRNK